MDARSENFLACLLRAIPLAHSSDLPPRLNLSGHSSLLRYKTPLHSLADSLDYPYRLLRTYLAVDTVILYPPFPVVLIWVLVRRKGGSCALTGRLKVRLTDLVALVLCSLRAPYTYVLFCTYVWTVVQTVTSKGSFPLLHFNSFLLHCAAVMSLHLRYPCGLHTSYGKWKRTYFLMKLEQDGRDVLLLFIS